ncbi:ATP-binding protein [Streptomyces sp. NBC_01310]|uniref:ATP-binding protein n=1 Tax=Streptomyces sp. NBC_01310 TaxID=2903820 RepID=UPI0035B5B5D1|nr:ATP-binding protein [Streptomyces sp. NBC_01310]
MLTITGSSAIPVVRSFAHWVTDPGAESVPQVRARVRATLEGWRVPCEAADVLLLAVSELVGNVVRHASAGRMRVGMAAGGGWLRLEVADRGVGLPRLPAPRSGIDPESAIDPESEDGRGLLIVQLLTVELGGELSFVAHEFGKSVRVCVPLA